MFGFNSLTKVIIYGVVMAIIGTIAGFVGSIVFKKYPIITKANVRTRRHAKLIVY